MKKGCRIVFKGTISKIKQEPHTKVLSILLTDLVDFRESPVIDYIWVSLPKAFNAEDFHVNATIEFEAKVSKYEPRSYYDFHEKERIPLRPDCILEDISGISFQDHTKL